MLVHDKEQEPLTSQCERDGTVVSIWLAKADGRLNIQVTKHTDKKPVTLVKLDGFYLCAEAIIELGFGEAIMPYAYAISKDEKDEYMEPFKTNVYMIVGHNWWPITIADQMTEAAQNMVGYFTGKTVTVGQMGGLKMTDRGEIDETVEMGDPWTETFELADDCVFCLKMTDESVLDRVAGYQWALDKEVAGRFGAGLVSDGAHGDDGSINVLTPKHYDHGDTDEERRAYHELLKPWYADHPMLLKVIPLIDLPLHLKRTLCIQWNHIVVEHLRVEPRFVYREEDGAYFWMNVPRDTDTTTKRIIPVIVTRSNPIEGGVSSNMWNPFAGGGGWPHGPF